MKNRHEKYNKKIRMPTGGCGFFHYCCSNCKCPIRPNKERISSRSCGEKLRRTKSFSSSIFFWTGSFKANPSLVALTLILRRLLGFKIRSMRPRFCMRSSTPDIVEFSTRRMLAISFGVSVSSFQRQANTPYCPGVMPNCERFSENIRKT